MTGDHDPARLGDYRAARIGAAGALTAVVVLLLVLDAISPTYEFSPVVLMPLLGTILTLLGIEALSFLRGAR